VEYADLAIIDISRAGTEEGRAELAIEVREALLNHGFFYVVNHGYSQDQARQFFYVVYIVNGISSQTNRIFDIADLPFTAVSDSEKQIYAGTMKQSGSYQGYKLRQYWVRDCRVSSNMQGAFGLRKLIEFSILTLGSVTSLRTITVRIMNSCFFH
jgi:isopenicillin N synthase-like dioxygenase